MVYQFGEATAGEKIKKMLKFRECLGRGAYLRS
jgi:hypothetical protein